MIGRPFAPERLQRFERELAVDPELAEHILRELPGLEEPERVVILCDRASADVAIARALALAVQGVEARIQLIL